VTSTGFVLCCSAVERLGVERRPARRFETPEG
jgi:hypothetical protein